MNHRHASGTGGPARMLAGLIRALLVITAIPCLAQSWKPEKTVEFFIGTTPGSSLDATARVVQKIWQDRNTVGVTVAVFNKPVGAEALNWPWFRSRPGDAHYLQLTSPTLLTNHITGVSPNNYTDITPIGILANRSVSLAVRADSSIRSGRELAERLKRDPTSVTFGINGIGNNLHILIAAVGKGAGADVLKLKTVVFKGGELMTAALGGHVDVISTVTSNILPHVQNGSLRIIGVATPQRLTGVLAGVPTWREQGVDVVLSNWVAAVADKGLNPAQIAYWDRVFAATTATDEWKAGLEKNLWEAQYLNSADMMASMKDDYPRMRTSLQDLGLAKR